MQTVLCWCARRTVEVSDADADAFETKSCGLTICDPDKDRYNWRLLHRKQPRRKAASR